MKRTTQRGVGILEIMVVLIVIGIGIIAIAGLQTNLFSGSAETKARAEALNLAKTKLEELKGYSAWGPSGTATCTGDGQYRCELTTGTFTDTYAGTNANFTRVWRIADETSTATSTNALVSKSGAKYLIAEVSWLAPDNTTQSISLDTYLSYVSPSAAVGATLGPDDTGTSAPKEPGGGGTLGMQEGAETDVRTNTSVYDDRGTTDTSDDLYSRTNSEGGMELIEGTGTNTNVILTSFGNRLITIKGTLYSADADWATSTSTYTYTSTSTSTSTAVSTGTGTTTAIGDYRIALVATTPSVCTVDNIQNCGSGLGSTCASAIDYTCILSGDCTNGGLNGTATGTTTIHIVANGAGNDLPVANPDSYYVLAGGTLSGNVLTNDFDADGSALRVYQALSLTAQSHPVNITSDGSFQVDLSSDGTFTGTDSFTYSITDYPATDTSTSSSTSTASGTVTFSAVTNATGNDLPMAVADTYHVLIGSTLSKQATSNDFDADGDTLTIRTNPAANPTRGSLELYPGGQFTYSPTGTTTGTDSFTYTLTEGNGCAPVATLPTDPAGKYNGGWYGNIGVVETFTGNGNSGMIVCQSDTTTLDGNTPTRFYTTERWTTGTGTATSVSTLSAYEGINGSYYCHDFLLLTDGNPNASDCTGKINAFDLNLAPTEITRSVTGTARNYAQPTNSSYCIAGTATSTSTSTSTSTDTCYCKKQGSISLDSAYTSAACCTAAMCTASAPAGVSNGDTWTTSCPASSTTTTTVASTTTTTAGGTTTTSVGGTTTTVASTTTTTLAGGNRCDCHKQNSTSYSVNATLSGGFCGTCTATLCQSYGASQANNSDYIIDCASATTTTTAPPTTTTTTAPPTTTTTTAPPTTTTTAPPTTTTTAPPTTTTTTAPPTTTTTTTSSTSSTSTTTTTVPNYTVTVSGQCNKNDRLTYSINSVGNTECRAAGSGTAAVTYTCTVTGPNGAAFRVCQNLSTGNCTVSACAGTITNGGTKACNFN